MTEPKVSVVITTRNEERNITNVIEGCRAQTYGAHEIIVIDNCSTDQTCFIAERLGAIVRTFGPERGAQRNHGICDVATGDVIVFLDADMTPTASLLQKCVEHLHDDVVALHIDEYILGSSFFSRIRRFERGFYSGTFIDGVRCFRRADFIAIGGFDARLPPGPEDWDLDTRFAEIGSIRLLPNAGGEVGPVASRVGADTGSPVPDGYVGVLHNESSLTLRTYLEKKTYYGPGLHAYRRKWGKDHPRVRKQLSPWYRLMWVFIEDRRYTRLVRHPLLALGMVALRLLVALRASPTLRRQRSSDVG